jgi:hypothetical protein
VAMCNDFGNRIPYSDYLAAFSETRIPIRWPSAAPNLEPRDDIWPTELSTRGPLRPCWLPIEQERDRPSE